jgi:hypothetical protein
VGYIEKNLVPGETLLYKTGSHWIVMLWSLVAGLVLAALGAFLAATASMGTFGTKYH